MKIAGGYLKGRDISFPKGLEARPTTNLARQALFNILQHSFELDDKQALDLFCGTALISFEFISRGAAGVTLVDKAYTAIAAAKKNAEQLNISQMQFMKSDVFSFLRSTTQKFDVIFADPPYHLPNIAEIKKLVFDRQLLNPGGLLIIEHPDRLNISDEDTADRRSYGQSAFTFFQ